LLKRLSKISKIIYTGLIIIVGLVLWPVRLFTDRSNCYYFVLEQRLLNGWKGKWVFSDDPFWSAYHVAYSLNGTEYHYVMSRNERLRLREEPWYVIPYLYYGSLKEKSNESKSTNKTNTSR
jgi:hypothetical protein